MPEPIEPKTILITPIDQEALEATIALHAHNLETAHERHMQVHGNRLAPAPSADSAREGLEYFIEANEAIYAMSWILGQAALHGGLVQVDEPTFSHLTRAHKFFAEDLA